MSLEKKAEKLFESITNLVDSVSNLISDGVKSDTAGAKKEGAKPAAGKPTAKVTKALEEAVMTKGSEVMKLCGKDVLTKLLGAFGCTKMSELKPGANVFEDFIERAGALVEKANVVEPPVEDPADPLDDGSEDAPTMDEVKASIKSVMEHAELGKNFALGILDVFKVKRIGDLEPNQYSDVIAKAEEEISKVAK